MKNHENNTPCTSSREVSFGVGEYAEVWRSVVEAVGEANYFNGKVVTSHAGFDSELTTTLIIYRDRNHPEHPITGVVPVWWEMATFDGEHPLPNDFSFRLLHDYAMQNK